MLTQFKESVSFIQSKTSVQPTIGIILGTGLGGLVKEITVIDEIEYKDDIATDEMEDFEELLIKLIGKKYQLQIVSAQSLRKYIGES